MRKQILKKRHEPMDIVQRFYHYYIAEVSTGCLKLKKLDREHRVNIIINLVIVVIIITRNTCIAEPREARGAGGGGQPIKCQGGKGERLGVNFKINLL